MESSITTETVRFSDYEQFLEKQVVIMTKDEIYYYGTLESFDQYNSLTLNYTKERIFYKNFYAEKHQGVIVVRGDVISLIGTINNDLSTFEKVSWQKMVNMINEEKQSEVLG